MIKQHSNILQNVRISKVLFWVGIGVLVLAVSEIVLTGFSFAQDNFSLPEGRVYVCPNATSIEQISPRCQGRIDLKLGETINGMTLTITNYEGKNYYLIAGFVNGGAGANLSPKANAGNSYKGYAGLPITFDASSSTDPNNDPLEYRWDFNNDGIWDTDWLDNPKITHLWKDDYKGIVKLEVSDGQLNATDTASVEIESPRTFKQEVVNELKKVKTGNSNKTTNKKINKIIWLINQSLDKNYWLDSSHLVFSGKKKKERFPKLKSGIMVFHYEKVATRLMIKEIKRRKTPEGLKNAFQEAIDKLVKADTLLTKVSLYDAENREIQNPKLKRIIKFQKFQIRLAKKELKRVQKELKRKREDKSITRLSRSWLYSQLAIRFARLTTGKEHHLHKLNLGKFGKGSPPRSLK